MTNPFTDLPDQKPKNPFVALPDAGNPFDNLPDEKPGLLSRLAGASGRVIQRGAEGGFEAATEGPIGLGQGPRQFFKETGVFAGTPEQAKGLPGLVRTGNELLIEGGAALADTAIIRPVIGLFEGALEASGQMVREFGGTETSARQFVRDTRALLTAGIVATGTGPLAIRPVGKAAKTRKADKIVNDAVKDLEPAKRPEAQAQLKLEIDKADLVQAESTVGAKQTPGPRGIPRELEEPRITAEIDAKVVTAATDLFLNRGIKRDTSIRVSDQISDLIDARQISIPEVEAALVRNNVSVDEFRALLRQDVTDAARRLGRRGQLVQQINAAFKGLETTEELLTFRQQLRVAKTTDMIREAWYNSLLSGPPTQGVNVASNALVASFTVPEQFVSGAIGAVRTAGTGGERVFMTEAAGRAYGLIAGMKEGINFAARAYKSESPSDIFTKLDQPRIKAIPTAVFRRQKEPKRIAGVPVPLTGPIELGGKQVRIPGRLLIAGDEFFKGIGRAQKLHELAIRDGIQKGIKRPGKLIEHVKKFVNDAVKLDEFGQPSEALLAARQAARVQTFTNELGAAGKAAINVREAIPGSWLIAPFMRTPVNIAKWSLKRTPLPLFFKNGEVRNQIRMGGVEKDIALGRIVFGSGVMTVIGSIAGGGLITGQGPSDPDKRALMRANGWQPYSVKVGDEYFSYAFYEPLGSLAGVAADFSEIRQEFPDIATNEEWDKLAAMITMSLTKNLTSKTYLRGINDMIKAIDDPDRFGRQWVNGLAGTSIPTGLAQIARLQDPTFREARSMLDKIRSRIPGFREELPPRLDPFGEPIVSQGAAGPDIVSRVFRSKIENDPVINELLRLDVLPSRTKKKIGGVELTPKQFRKFTEFSRKPLKKDLDAVIASPEYGALLDFDKERLLRRAIQRATKTGRQELLLAFPELDEKLIDKQLSKIR